LIEPERPTVASLLKKQGYHTACISKRQGNWKAIFDCADSGGWPTPRGTHPQPDSPGQRYDRSVDPAEQHNLWNDREDAVTRLCDMLNRFKETGRSAPYPAGLQIQSFSYWWP